MKSENRIVTRILWIFSDDRQNGGLRMEGEPDWISRMAEEQVIVRQSSGEEADRSSSEGAQEDEDPVSVAPQAWYLCNGEF